MEKHIDTVVVQELEKKAKQEQLEDTFVDILRQKEKERLEQEEQKRKLGL